MGIFGTAQAPWREAGFRVILAPQNRGLANGQPSGFLWAEQVRSSESTTCYTGGPWRRSQKYAKNRPPKLAPELRFQAQAFSAQDMSDWSEQVCSDLRSFRPLASRNCSCSRGSSVDFPASVLFASVSSIFRLQSVG